MKVAKTMRYAVSHHTLEGTAAKLVPPSCGRVKGRESKKDTRNIHFIIVMDEYFIVRGRQVPRYKAKTVLFAIHSSTPPSCVALAPSPVATLCSISQTIPPKLMATPITYFHVMGSRRNIAAANMVRMGVMLLFIDRSTGPCMVMAKRNVS